MEIRVENIDTNYREGQKRWREKDKLQDTFLNTINVFFLKGYKKIKRVLNNDLFGLLFTRYV